MESRERKKRGITTKGRIRERENNYEKIRKNQIIIVSSIKKIGYEYERWNKDKKDKYESVQMPTETRKKAK